MGNLAYKYEDERPYEVYGGEIVMMAGPSLAHIQVAVNIFDIFNRFLKGKKCRVFPDGVDVFFEDEEEKTELIPDVTVVCDPDKIKSDGIHGAPDLVVEVLSPSTGKRDKTVKKDIYERNGVREYWIVAAAEKVVEQYVLRNGRFELDGYFHAYADWELEKLKREDKQAVADFKTTIFDDLAIKVDDVFDRID